MHITNEVSLGTILTIVTLIGIAVRFGYRIGNFETTLKSHAEILSTHSKRMGDYEGRIIDVIGHLQRVVGRVEAMTERRQQPRQ